MPAVLRRPGNERRVGRRVGVRLPVKVSSPRGQKKVLKRRGEDAVVVDVSVTGMALDAPAAKGLQRGIVIHVAADGVEGDVVVRHIDLRDATSRVGVQFLDSHSPLAHWAFAQVESNIGNAM